MDDQQTPVVPPQQASTTYHTLSAYHLPHQQYYSNYSQPYIHASRGATGTHYYNYNYNMQYYNYPQQQNYYYPQQNTRYQQRYHSQSSPVHHTQLQNNQENNPPAQPYQHNNYKHKYSKRIIQTKLNYCIAVKLSPPRITSDSVQTIFTLKQLPCTLDVTTSGATKAIFSFANLTVLMEAQNYATQLGYKSKIIRNSVPKTFFKDKEAVLSYPVSEPTNNVIYVQTEEEVANACSLLEKEARTDSHCILGLDCEWKPEFQKGQKNPIAVIQIASMTTSVVFHISLMQSKRGLPPALLALLSNDEIVKVVLTSADVTRILNEHQISLNYIDLQKLPIAYRFSGLGLGTMVAIFFKEKLSKTKRLSNWSLPLDPQQIKYAALDAEITRRLYFTIKGLPVD